MNSKKQVTIIQELKKIKELDIQDREILKKQGSKIKSRARENTYLLSQVTMAKKKKNNVTTDPSTELTLELFSENFEIINEKFKSYKLLVDNLYSKIGKLGNLVIELNDELQTQLSLNESKKEKV